MTAVTTTPGNQFATATSPTIKNLLMNESIQKRFNEMLGKKAPGFISSILSVVNGNTDLSKCEPNSIVMAAAIAASLDLAINPNLGHAFIVPYKQKYQDPNDGQWKDKYVAQFQMGWKGFVQLAERSGQYKTIGASEVRAGQLKKYNPLTSEFEFDFSIEGGEIIGYAAYFKFLNGFEKIVYWNVGKIHEHAKEYSKAFQYDLKFSKKSSVWTTNFDAQAKKTLVKNILSQWGILSIEMANAVKFDQAVIKDEAGDNIEYVDNTDISNQKNIEQKTENVSHEDVTASEVKENNLPNSSDL